MTATEKRAIGDMKAGLTGRHGARPQLSILPRAGMTYGSRALEYGAAKYARGNYHGPAPAALGPNAPVMRLLGYLDAALRHGTRISSAVNRALGTGGDLRAAAGIVDDQASGGFPPSMLPDLAHMAASVLLAIECAVDDGIIAEDPGQPWVALLQATGEAGLPQKDNPAAERARVDALANSTYYADGAVRAVPRADVKPGEPVGPASITPRWAGGDVLHPGDLEPAPASTYPTGVRL